MIYNFIKFRTEYSMGKVKRVAANLPEDLLASAICVTNKSITETIIEGLERVKRSSAFSKAQLLKGKLNLEIDINKSRNRS